MRDRIKSRLATLKKKQIAFSEAYKKHSAALFRFSFYKLSDQEASKDILQETFIKAWAYISKHGAVKNTRAFLYKITSNLIIDEYRKRKHNDSLDTLKESGFDPSFDDTHAWMEKIDGKKAVQLLEKMPEPYRTALHMKYIEDLSLQEIAKKTGEHENAIAVRLHRGIIKLKELYKF